MRHITVYKDPDHYIAFPSIVRLPDGDILVSFREAGRLSVEKARTGSHTHLDPDVRVCLVRSTDGGETWDPATKTVIYDEGLDAGVSLVVLSDGVVLAALNQLWHLVPRERRHELKGALHRHDSALGLVGRITGCASRRSFDGGRTWSTEIVPVPLGPGTDVAVDARTAPIELPDGSLLWSLSDAPTGATVRSWVVHSWDRGASWEDPRLAAGDPAGDRSPYTGIGFTEPTILSVGDGRIIALHRTHPNDSPGEGFLYQSVSTDWGLSWRPPFRTPMWGHPAHLLRLRSGAILATYGHRRPPYGVRACLSHDNGQTWDIEHETILREDGLGRDLGYPYSIQFEDGTILTVYYFYGDDHLRHIAGTFWRA
jgi:sialidase-1